MPTRLDFNGDGRADIFVKQPGASGGQFGVLVSNGSGHNFVHLGSYVSANQPSGVAFLSNDGRVDVMRQDASFVVIDERHLLGVSVSTGSAANFIAGQYDLLPNHIYADLDGNGVDDIVMRGDFQPGVAGRTFTGVNQVSGNAIIADSDLAYRLAAGGDFNGDGNDDILLLNNTNGGVAVWSMNGLTVTNAAVVALYDLSWSFKGVGDVDGDGDDDIVWQNNAGTAVAVWKMQNGAVDSAAVVAISDPHWTLEEVADFSGDGRADLLWRHDGGLLAYWKLDGYAVTEVVTVGNPGVDWSII